jgi:hypothetical protein
MAWNGHVGRKREGRNAYSVLAGKLERRLLGTPRRRYEDNIKMDLQEAGWNAWT